MATRTREFRSNWLAVAVHLESFTGFQETGKFRGHFQSRTAEPWAPLRSTRDIRCVESSLFMCLRAGFSPGHMRDWPIHAQVHGNATSFLGLGRRYRHICCHDCPGSMHMGLGHGLANREWRSAQELDWYMDRLCLLSPYLGPFFQMQRDVFSWKGMLSCNHAWTYVHMLHAIVRHHTSSWFGSSPIQLSVSSFWFGRCSSIDQKWRMHMVRYVDC